MTAACRPRASALRRLAPALGVTMDEIALADAKVTAGDVTPAVVPDAPSDGSPGGGANDATGVGE